MKETKKKDITELMEVLKLKNNNTPHIISLAELNDLLKSSLVRKFGG